LTFVPLKVGETLPTTIIRYGYHHIFEELKNGGAGREELEELVAKNCLEELVAKNCFGQSCRRNSIIAHEDEMTLCIW